MPHRAKRKSDFDQSLIPNEENERVKRKAIKRRKRRGSHGSPVPCTSQAAHSNSSDIVLEDLESEYHAPKQYESSQSKNVYRNSMLKKFRKRIVSVKTLNDSSESAQEDSASKHSPSEEFLSNATQNNFLHEDDPSNSISNESSLICSVPDSDSIFSVSKLNTKLKRHKTLKNSSSKSARKGFSIKSFPAPSCTQTSAFNSELESSVSNDITNCFEARKIPKKSIQKRGRIPAFNSELESYVSNDTTNCFETRKTPKKSIQKRGRIPAFNSELESCVTNDTTNCFETKKTPKKSIPKRGRITANKSFQDPIFNDTKKRAKRKPSATKNTKKRISTKNNVSKKSASDCTERKRNKTKVSVCNNGDEFFVPKSVTLSVAAYLGRTLTLPGKNGISNNFLTPQKCRNTLKSKISKFNSQVIKGHKNHPENSRQGRKLKHSSTSNVKTTRPSTENSIAHSIIPRRVAAVKADQKRVAVQTVQLKKEKPNPHSSEIRSFFEPISWKVFGKIISQITYKIKPVIQKVLQQFTKAEFVLGDYISYPHYQKLQYELEKLFYSLVKILVKLSNILPRLERRFTYLAKKLNIVVPKQREKRIFVPVIPLFQNAQKRKVNFPQVQRKPRQRKPLPKLEGEVLKFWSFIEYYTGGIIPLIKVRNVVRRDNRSRAITNVQNFEDLKLLQSTSLEEEYLKFPSQRDPHHQIFSKKTSKEQKSDMKNSLKPEKKPDLFGKLTSLLDSLKVLFAKNNDWLQNLLKWVEREIEKQHVKKLLTSNDKIVAQMCDEVLEILYYERDFTEKQRKMVLDYLRTRRKCLLEFKKFCFNKRHSVPPEEQHSHRCQSTLCKECLIPKRAKKHNIKYVCL